MSRALLVAFAAVLACAGAALAASPTALAGGIYGEVLSPSGSVVTTAHGASFDYPADGSLVHVGQATVSNGDVTLNDVALVGNLVQATQLFVPAAEDQPLQGTIVAGGSVVAATPNTLVQLGSAGYVVVDQRATADGRVGRVGLRVVLTQETLRCSGRDADRLGSLRAVEARSGSERRGGRAGEPARCARVLARRGAADRVRRPAVDDIGVDR